MVLSVRSPDHQTRILRRDFREKRPPEFRGRIIHSFNFHPRRKGGSACALPPMLYEVDGSTTNVLFGREIDADAFILRIRVWWSGARSYLDYCSAIRLAHQYSV
jgi:hypothetical protein